MRTMIIELLEKQILTPSSIDKVVLINKIKYENTRKLGPGRHKLPQTVGFVFYY